MAAFSSLPGGQMCRRGSVRTASVPGKVCLVRTHHICLFFLLYCDVIKTRVQCGSSHQRSLPQAGSCTKGFTTVIISAGEQADKVKGSLICLCCYFIRMWLALTTERLSSERKNLQKKARCNIGSQASALLVCSLSRNRPDISRPCSNWDQV